LQADRAQHTACCGLLPLALLEVMQHIAARQAS